MSQKKIFITGVLLILPLILPAQVTSTQQRVIQVKLEQEIAPQVQAAALNAIPGKMLSVGITSLDSKNKKYSARKMRRIFSDAGKFEQKHRKHGLHLWYEIYFEEDINVESVAKDYAMDNNIEKASPIYNVSFVGFNEADYHNSNITTNIQAAPASAPTNDPLMYNQWHYNNTGTATRSVAGVDIRLFDAWQTTMGNNDLIVAIVDGGVDYRHEDLAGNMWVNRPELNGIPGLDDDGNGYIDDVYGYNFVSDTGPIAAHDHGTHVAGTVGAVNNNGIGVAGVAGGSGAGNGVRLMSCQIFENNKRGLGTTTPNAIVYAADQGAIILQNSWGYEKPGVYNSADLDAINYFIATAGTDENGDPLPNTYMVGGIVIFAAGNDGTNALWYPGAFPQVFSVAAVGPDGQKAYYSNYGSWVDITAPGGVTDVSGRGVYSTLPGNKYGYKQGTSMACPHVSGIAALVLSKYGHPAYTPDSLRERLLHNPISLEEWDPYYAPLMGAGLINAKSALAPYVKVTGISLPASQEVQVDRSLKLTPGFQPADAFNQAVQWTSSNEQIAGISTKGVITGISEGGATITATTMEGGYTASCLITVSKVRVTGVSLSASTMAIEPGQRERLTATISPEDANDKTLVWSSSNSTVASVDNNGWVTAHQYGTSTITVTAVDGGYTAACLLSVVTFVSGVEFPYTYLNLLKGKEIQAVAIVKPENASNKNISWSIDNTAIATVNTSGLVTGVGPGVTSLRVITADGGYSSLCSINVFSGERAPEAFSPNNDGINDYFEFTLDDQKTYALQVFDNSGQFYYRSDDYKNNWDGIANTGANSGNKVLPGTYFYQLISNTGDKISGYVVIKY